MDKRVEFFKRDKLAQTLNFKILEADLGYAKCSCKLEDKHMNGVNILHGGTIFSLADFALAVASNYSKEISVSTNATINYMKTTKQNEIYAICKVINETRKLGFYNVIVKDKEKVLSRMEATVYKTGKRNKWMEKYSQFNDEEFDEISKKYNIDAIIEEETIEITDDFYGYMNHNIQNNRRAEVGFLVETKEEGYVLITCREYPENVYRVPTGGLEYGEDIVKALMREMKEELGLEVQIKDFIGTIKTNMEAPVGKIAFYSYLFIVKEIDGKILEDATDDEISEIKVVNKNELFEYAKQLEDIKEDRWKSWGKFRAITTRKYAKYLNN